VFLYLGWTTDYRSTPTEISFSAGSGASRSPHVFSGVFIAEEVDGVRDKWSGDATMFDVQILLEEW